MRVSRPATVLASLAAVLATTVALLGVVPGTTATAATTSSAASARQDGPGYQQPRVGACRTITYAQGAAVSNSTRPISCRRSHTVRTVAVPRLPAGVDWDASDEKLGRVVTRACQPAVDRVLGRTARVRDLSAYSWFWFKPTRAQREHGARWLRCDLTLRAGTHVLELRRDRRPVLGGLPHADRVARCLTSDVVTTSCARTHVWRATGTFVKKGGYDTAALDRAGLRRCPGKTSGERFRWTYRSETAWKLGDHVIVCYTRTRS
ncbi:septum formation family protein [Nocardioides sp. KIGAM211]|uniref:Septum formation family protein n=1 Tax=Nocardioides luti TaxID=2761101 RepID=A0A7X0RHH5_9ACTN|nr:septum formation family protein [Nocardioides luti]MBB6628371.1 septum formation family protein [Nocardioides luti]